MPVTTLLLYGTIIGMFLAFGVVLFWAERRAGKR